MSKKLHVNTELRRCPWAKGDNYIQYHDTEWGVLVHAVYFKGIWTTTFEESGTKEAPFHIDLSNKIKVQMMHQHTECAHANVGGVQVLDLPYGNQDLSMIVLLPNRVDGLAELEASLSVSNVSKWLTALSPQPTKVFLPKFRLTERFALAGVLKSMGMATAFDITAADFFGVTDPGACILIPICISEVIHKASVEVNEEGSQP